MKFLFIFLGLSSFLPAQEEPLDLQSSTSHIINRRENYFLTSTDYRILPKVNPISGEYSEEETDLIISGAEPLSLRRFYNHVAPYDARYASWRYNPECFLAANFEWKGQEIFAAVGEREGSVCCYKHSVSFARTFNYDIPKGFAITSSSGQCHPLNTHINFCTVGDYKRFEYQGSIKDGSGRERLFKSPAHCWNRSFDYIVKKSGFLWSSEKTYEIHPHVWTPYQVAIQEEKLPNGNIICYTYTRWQKSWGYPKPELINSITAYNKNKSKVLGSLQFTYVKTKDDDVAEVLVKGSDGRQARMRHYVRKVQPTLLTSAERAGQPQISYGYEGRNLNLVEKLEGRALKTIYTNGKVSAQYAPVGPQGEMHPIARYDYQNGATIVYDALGLKTIYRYDENKKITSIDTPYHVTRFVWDVKSGNLLRKTIEDISGKIFQISEYQYDKNHNLITEKIGDGKQSHTIKRTYSDDGFNLKLSESDGEDRRTLYSYAPKTNLLVAELFYEKNIIRKRTFYTYDDCAVLIKTIIDDGSTKDPSHLQGVTYRKITETSPKKQMPCLGLDLLPEI